MEPHQWLNIAEACAIRAGEALRRFFVERDFRVWEKKDEWGLVTDADKTADSLIREFLAAATPNVPVLSEEGDTRYPAGVEDLWIVDPLDGTTNFVAGLPWWGVLVAYLHRGEPVAAAMYFPILDELFVALQGHGAWHNGKPVQVRVAEWRETHFMYVCSDTPWRYRFNLPKYKMRSLGCGAYHIGLVASGYGVLSFNCSPFVWDFSAPVLVAQEAGAAVGTLEGRPLFPLEPGRDYGEAYHTLLVAAEARFLEEARQGMIPLGL